MPVDARIPLMGVAPELKPFDVTTSLKTAMQMQAAQQESRLMDLKFGEVQRGIEEQRTLRDAFRTNTQVDPQTGKSSLNEEGFLSAYGRIAPEKAITLGQTLRKGRAETKQADLATTEKQAKLVNQVSYSILEAERRGVDPQEAYTRGVASLRQMGIPTEHLPPTYNRELVQQYHDESLDAVQRLAQMSQAQQQKQFEQSQATAMRGQDLSAQSAQEGHQVQREGQQVTAQGQQISAQSAREGHQVTREGQQVSAQTTREGHQISAQAQEGARQDRQLTRELQQQTQTQQQQKATVETEGKLRDDFQGVTKNFREVRDAWGRVQVSVTNPSPAGDISLVFAYMKLLDPGSTVREGEQATVNNAGTIPQQITAQYNRLLSGEGRMDPAIRQDLAQRAASLYQQYEQDYTKTEQQYQGIASRSGANPANVAVDSRTTAPTTVPKGPGAQQQPPGQGARQAQPPQAEMREVDIQVTMKSTGKSRAEIIAAARAQGLKVPAR